MIESFHFLRPLWLLLLIPLLLSVWLLLRTSIHGDGWRAVIDARLLPHVLIGSEARRSLLRWMLLLVALLGVLALAGPTWEKLPQPVYHKNASMVIALDLSRSMNATDVKPSRLVRARHKVSDILNLKIEGQSALLVYAADAFTVTPLTTDTDTILALLPGLDSELMPAQGTRADRAVALAFELLSNAGIVRGDVLLVSDGLSERELEQTRTLHQQNPGHRLSVLAVGTAEGGPIPLGKGGFLKDGDGAIVIARLREDNLRRLAQSGGGVFATLSADDIDINTIAYLFDSGIDEREASLSDRSADLWRELGPWLILFSLPLAALTFRRGLVWMFPLILLLLPPAADAIDWQALWQNRDQRASRMFEQGRHGDAAQLFDDESWRAAAKYRAGDYAGALEIWERQEQETALYNRANALAGQKLYQQALDAYAALLERNPEHADARHNRQVLEDWLRQQQQQQQAGQDQSQQDQSQQGQDQQAQGSPGNQAQQSGEQGEPQQAQSSEAQGEQQSAEQQAQNSSAESSQAQADIRPGDSREPTAEEAQSEAREQLASVDEQMSAQAAEQWLRKIPDDPGGLLRRKFLYQYRKRGGVETEAQPW